MENGIIEEIKEKVAMRARVPQGFDIGKHRATMFKRDNYEGFYTIDSDGLYTYKCVSAEACIHYSQMALLAMSNMEVVSFTLLQNGY